MAMPVLGIVAEYDPFHNGHLRHLREAVSAVSPSAVLVALSGPFKQRGEASLLSPYARAACALDAGADAVFALPVRWTVRDAEHYAVGAVHVLAAMGATHLAFGAETADLPLLRRTADLLEDPPAQMRSALHTFLAEGAGYPAAMAHAAGTVLPESREILNRPNNILAVCYLRAIRRLGLSVIPVAVPRSGAYHADRVSPSEPSASAVRGALLRGAWAGALESLPPFSAKSVRESFLTGCVPDLKRLDAFLSARLRAMSPEDAAQLPGVSEGLDTALLHAASLSDSREGIIASLSTRRYPAARVSRLCTCAMLGIRRRDPEEDPLPDRVLLLALKKNPSLTGSWKNGAVRACNAASWLKDADPEDRAAWQLWALAAGLPASWPFTRKPAAGKDPA